MTTAADTTQTQNTAQSEVEKDDDNDDNILMMDSNEPIPTTTNIKVEDFTGDDPSITKDNDEGLAEGSDVNTNEVDGANEVENDNKDDNDQTESNEEVKAALGGKIDKPAFALLTGIYEETNDDTGNVTKVPIKLAITALPATIGRARSSKTPDQVFALGPCKALSRNHALIYYRDAHGGKLGKFTDSNETDKTVNDDWTYRGPPKEQKDGGNDKKVIRPKSDDNDNDDGALPKEGFFVIECLGKNRIFVGKQRVQQGEVALLTHGTSIQMASFSLYFLLPTDAPSTTISVLDPTEEALASDDDDENALTMSSPARKKQKIERPVSELLKEFHEAFETNTFERKHQMISGIIINHAVREAAHDAKLQKMSKAGNGVSRSEIIDWIGRCKKYTKWVDRVLEMVEMKSYQSNISKALTKEKFTRVGTTGRHVTWKLPDYIVNKSTAAGTTGEEVQDDDDASVQSKKREKSSGQNGVVSDDEVMNHVDSDGDGANNSNDEAAVDAPSKDEESDAESRLES